MPKRHYDPDGDDYGEVYGDVYGKAKRTERDNNKELYGETTNTYGSTSTGTSGHASSILKYFVIGFTVVTIGCFSAAFVLIMQLRQEVTQLQNSDANPSETPDTTAQPTVTQPSPFTATLGTTRSLPEVADGRVAAALRQLTEADTQIREAFEQMSKDFRSLQEWTEQSISQSSNKINQDLCGLENLLEQWAVPSDTVGTLLSLEGWMKVPQGLYVKQFSQPNDHYRTYADAKIECEKLGARLASKSLRHLGNRKVQLRDMWVGYDDIQSEGVWIWSDGRTTFYASILQWGERQPDNIEGDEDCAYILEFSNGKYILNDLNCQRRKLYICEKDISSLSSSDTCQ